MACQPEPATRESTKRRHSSERGPRFTISPATTMASGFQRATWSATASSAARFPWMSARTASLCIVACGRRTTACLVSTRRIGVYYNREGPARLETRPGSFGPVDVGVADLLDYAVAALDSIQHFDRPAILFERELGYPIVGLTRLAF